MITQIILVSAIISFTAALLYFGLRFLKRTEQKHLSRTEEMDISEAVETDSPEEDIDNITRKRAIGSIQGRFDFIRRSFVPALLLASLILLLIATLPAISAGYITLFAGVIVVLFGMIAKPFVENFMAGLVITFSQPVRIGDTIVIDNQYGTIEKISMFFTVVKVWTWRRYVIPNSSLLNKEIENLSMHDENEWVYVPFWVEPRADLEKVKLLAKEVMGSSQYLEKIENPSFWVMDLEKTAIKCWIAGWAHTPARAWALKADTKKRLAMALQRENIDFQLQRGQIQISENEPKIKC